MSSNNCKHPFNAEILAKQGLSSYGNISAIGDITTTHNVHASHNITADHDIFGTNITASDTITSHDINTTNLHADDMIVNNFIVLNTDPLNDNHAVNKRYADALRSGMSYKEPVKVKSTVNLNANYDNISLTLTSTFFSNGSFTLDDISLNVGDRVLITNQTNSKHNGIYVLTDIGSASDPWILTRSSDANSNSKVQANMSVLVSEGTMYGDTGYVLITDAPIDLGNTDLTFIQNSSAGVMSLESVGDGVEIIKSKSGTIYSVKDIKAGSNKVTVTNDVNSNNILIDIVPTNITQVGTLTSLSVSGNETIGGTLNVTGNTNLSTLTTSGLAQLHDLSTVGDASIGGNETITGTLSVNGATSLSSLTTSGSATLNSASITTTLNVNGDTTLNDLEVNGSEIINGTLNVTGATTLDSTLDVAGTSTLSNTVINGDLSINGLVNGRNLISDSAILDSLNSVTNNNVTTLLFDDFITSSLEPIWVVDMLDNASDVLVIDGLGGQLKLLTGTTTNNYSQLRICQNNIKLNANCTIKFRVRLGATTNMNTEFGLANNDQDNFVRFSTNNSSSWSCASNSSTNVFNGSGQNIDTNWHIFKIVTTSTTIKYYIDNTLVATNSTVNTMYPGLMHIYIRQTSLGSVTYSLLDYIKCETDRE